MSGGGGKGGSSNSSQQIDPGLTAAARDALDFASAGAAMPFSANRGVQIAGFTPQQEAGMAAADTAAAAFGLPSTGGVTGMPATETSATGIQGYSTGGEFDAMRDASMSPGLQDALAQLFADPTTGEFDGPSGPLYSGRYAAMPGIPQASGGK